MELKMETAVKKARLLTLAQNESDQSPEFLLLWEVSSIFEPSLKGWCFLFYLTMFAKGTSLLLHSPNIAHVIELYQCHGIIWRESVPSLSY